MRPVKHSIDKTSDLPLYLQIRNQIKSAILRGDLVEGQRLPSERQLATELGINRTTVVNAYRELAAEGLVEGHVGRGTIVSISRPLDDREARSRPVAWDQYFVKAAQWAHSNILQEVAEIAAQPELISFASGVPAPELYPLQELRESMDLLFRDSNPELLANCPAEGYYPLRQWLSDWLNDQGMDLTYEIILVTSGSTQALALIVHLFIQPHDEIITETPTSLAALQTFTDAQAQLSSVPLDSEGISTDVLEDILRRRRPKLIYVLPTFQNPTGRTWSLRRRTDFMHLAQQYGIPVVEDDPYSLLYYDSPPPPSLKALDKHGHVIYTSTFSKLVFPGLRVGWIAAAQPVIRRLAAIKRNTDLFTNAMVQGALCYCLRGHDWPAYLGKLRLAYRRRRDTMIEALHHHAPPGLRWEIPAGGFYLWLSLPSGLRAQHLLSEVRQTGVVFVPGEPFYVNGGGRDMIRLNFSHASEKQIEEGMRRLILAVNNLIEKRIEDRTISEPTAAII